MSCVKILCHLDILCGNERTQMSLACEICGKDIINFNSTTTVNDECASSALNQRNARGYCISKTLLLTADTLGRPAYKEIISVIYECMKTICVIFLLQTDTFPIEYPLI